MLTLVGTASVPFADIELGSAYVSDAAIAVIEICDQPGPLQTLRSEV